MTFGTALVDHRILYFLMSATETLAQVPVAELCVCVAVCLTLVTVNNSVNCTVGLFSSVQNAVCGILRHRPPLLCCCSPFSNLLMPLLQFSSISVSAVPHSLISPSKFYFFFFRGIMSTVFFIRTITIAVTFVISIYPYFQLHTGQCLRSIYCLATRFDLVHR